ncbi:hypothetical protein V495_02274 [Pseudogymnoascus sp. VKM F-4514 (FW-929)]|nr:hypothetical protein V495_02274 [Pseudogymnoascus sp. VKM F-4514 (FW-929)]
MHLLERVEGGLAERGEQLDRVKISTLGADRARIGAATLPHIPSRTMRRKTPPPLLLGGDGRISPGHSLLPTSKLCWSGATSVARREVTTTTAGSCKPPTLSTLLRTFCDIYATGISLAKIRFARIIPLVNMIRSPLCSADWPSRPAAGSAIIGSISTETWGLFFLGTGGSPRCNLTCGWRVEGVTPATAPWKETRNPHNMWRVDARREGHYLPLVSINQLRCLLSGKWAIDAGSQPSAYGCRGRRDREKEYFPQSNTRLTRTAAQHLTAPSISTHRSLTTTRRNTTQHDATQLRIGMVDAAFGSTMAERDLGGQDTAILVSLLGNASLSNVLDQKKHSVFCTP